MTTRALGRTCCGGCATSACRAIASGPGNAVRPGGSRQRKRERVKRCEGVCERGAAAATHRREEQAMTLDEITEGMRVLYIPHHAEGQRTHPDCVRGVVTAKDAS